MQAETLQKVFVVAMEIIDELVAEHDSRSADRMRKPGHGPIPDTGGIAWARAFVEGIGGEALERILSETES